MRLKFARLETIIASYFLAGTARQRLASDHSVATAPHGRPHPVLHAPAPARHFLLARPRDHSPRFETGQFAGDPQLRLENHRLWLGSRAS